MDRDRGSADHADRIEQAVAPECDQVSELKAALPEDVEPTGDDPEPIQAEPDMAGDAPLPVDRQVERWGSKEGAETFAGVWFDEDVGGYLVALANDVDRYTQLVRERFHPGLAVAAADNAYAELRDIAGRIERQEGSEQFGEPGAVDAAAAIVVINRVRVRIFEPDAEQLAELSESYGTDAICFDIEDAPGELPDGIDALAKAEGWREGLEGVTMIEVAYDRDTAERAWRDSVPDGLAQRDDDLPPAAVGLYGDLADVDFATHAVIVWSSTESGSCPGWLADIDTIDGAVHVEVGATGDRCTDDAAPYRMVLAVDRDRLPEPDALPQDHIEPLTFGTVSTYPHADSTDVPAADQGPPVESASTRDSRSTASRTCRADAASRQVEAFLA